MAEELPWQWKQAEEKAGLTRCLMRREIFESLYDRESYELLSYWLWSNKEIEQSLKLLWSRSQPNNGEKDLGKKPVQRALESIWGSRSGLYQEELLALAGLAPVQWAEIQNALDESLYESSGKINFGHDYLRKAVEDRYGLIGKKRLGLHKRLAEWFERREVNARVAEELPWQWKLIEKYCGRGFDSRLVHQKYIALH